MGQLKSSSTYAKCRIQNRIHMGILALTAVLLMIGGVLVVQANNSQTDTVQYAIHAQSAASKTTSKRVRYYKSVQVKPGDSLWSIAREYRTEDFPSIYAYIEEIYKLNELQSETIHAGTYLMVICYKDV